MFFRIQWIAYGLLLLSGWNCQPQHTNTEVVASDNTLTAAEQSEGWQLLFDGTSTSLWRGYNRDTLPVTWQAKDGKFSLMPGEGSGDIITKEKYSNFELQIDFMLTDSANSGILYFVQEEADKTIWQNAPEYQLLDDATYIEMYGAEQMKKHLTGDNYDLQSAPASYLKPMEEWNTAKIIVNNGKVTHYLNGNKTVEYDVNSEDFKNLVVNSKFKEYPNFAQAKEGHIGLQDHGHPIYFKNMKVRRL